MINYIETIFIFAGGHLADIFYCYEGINLFRLEKTH